MLNNNFDYLHIIAHPDDDAIFGGVFQKTFDFCKWGIVCLTYNKEHERGKELINWQQHLNIYPGAIFFLDFPDNPLDLENNKCSFKKTDVALALKRLNLKCNFILTHNQYGEYGHPHHMMVNECVKEVYSNIKIIEYAFGSKNYTQELSVACQYELALNSYKSQSEIIQYYHKTYNSFTKSRYSKA